MKKLLICLLGVFLISSVALAQQFSSSLGGGSGSVGYAKTTTVKSKAKQNIAKAVANRRSVIKTVLHYTPAQVNLSEEHEAQIMPIIRRIQEGRTKSVEIVGIARNYNANYHRQNNLRQLFMGYTPNIQPSFRQITGASVFNSNDNTVEIYEYF